MYSIEYFRWTSEKTLLTHVKISRTRSFQRREKGYCTVSSKEIFAAKDAVLYLANDALSHQWKDQ